MKRRRRSFHLWFVGALCVLGLGRLESAEAACPNVCDCVGAAKNFNLVASKMMVVQEASYNYYGYSQLIETYVDGDVCAPRLLASGPAGYPTYIYDALATNSKGIAASFAKKGPELYVGNYGVSTNLVATGGGSVKGLANLSTYSLDTTGTHPEVETCRQAIVDMQTASAALAALPPTQVMGNVLVKGDYLTIEAEPGVTVIDATRLLVLPASYYGYPQNGVIDIVTDTDTEAVIINTRSLVVGELCQIYSDDPTKVIINVVGPGPTVKVGTFGLVDMAILAPERTVSVGLQLGDFGVGGVMARRVRLKGSTTYGSLDDCPS